MSKVDEMVEMMNLQDRVGQMLMAGFDGLTAPAYFLDWLREGRLGGVILFARNVESPAQLADLLRDLHAAAKYPLLIGIDQEGGTVARLRDGFSESPGAMALASIATGAETAVESMSNLLGREMAALGINWTYAPVVDVTYNAENPTVGTRSFGSDPESVAALAAAATRGFQAAGVAACAKHFPGLGNTAIDTHLALPRLETPLDALENDLLPYRACMADGLATIMTTHTVFTALDADHPATLSPHVIERLIRRELGFDGVVTTDCMEMKAIADNYGVAESVTRAANAGVDVILFSHTPETQAAAYDALLKAAGSDVPLPIIDAANQRIAALKARFPAHIGDISAVGGSVHQALTDAAARAGTTQQRDQGVLPLHPADSRRILLVEFAPGITTIAQGDESATRLIGYVRERLPNVQTMALPAKPDAAKVAAACDHDADVLILATRSAHLNPAQAEAVRKLSATSANVILLALRNPYDAALIDGGTVICTAGDSLPSLRAAADALAGAFVPSGRLPVDV